MKLPVLPRRFLLTAVAVVAAATPAQAHVKWFAPYIVGAPPQQIGATLANGVRSVSRWLPMLRDARAARSSA